MASWCSLCCHPVTPDKRSTLDQRLLHCLCKTLKTRGPNNFRTPLTENPVCSPCSELLKTADETLRELEELELRVADIAEDLKCVLKRGYSTLKESRELPYQEPELKATDVQIFLFEAAGVKTGEDYIAVVPLSHDGRDCYDDGIQQDSFSPLDTGASYEDGEDDMEVIETEKSDAIRLYVTQTLKEEANGHVASDLVDEVVKATREFASNAAALPAQSADSSSNTQSIGTEQQGLNDAEPTQVQCPSEDDPTKTMHNGRKFTCAYRGCKTILSYIHELKSHLIEPHEVTDENNTDFSCSECGEKYVTYQAFFEHQTSTHRVGTSARAVVLCQFCGRDYSSVKALRSHLKGHYCKPVGTDTRTAKSQSKRRNSTVGDKLNNGNGRQNGEYCCYDDCREKFESIKALRVHMLTPHDVEITNTNLKFNCEKCEQCFPTYVDIFGHLNSEHAVEANPNLVPLFCQKCCAVFTSVRTLKEHFKNHQSKRHLDPQGNSKKYYCFHDGCYETYQSYTGWRAHISKPHYDDIVNSNLEFHCEKCEQRFPSYVGMFSHLTSQHITEVSPRLVPIYCQKCGKNFTAFRKLEEHMRDHRRETVSPYSCSRCGKKFIKEGFLRRHQPICGKNQGKGPWSCRICRKVFSNWWLYRKHMIGYNLCILTKRKEHEKFVCRGCGKSFQKHKILKKHYKICKDERRRRKSCPYRGCTKCFTGELMLHVHVRKPHDFEVPIDDNGKRPYFGCHVCKKLFASYQVAATHVKQDHPNESPLGRLPCQFCGKIYKNIELLRAHLKDHAGGLSICESCGKSYRSRAILHWHLRTSSCKTQLNTKEDEHVCTGCSKSFTREKFLQRHMMAGCPEENKGPGDLHCKFCGRDFPTYSARRTHEYSHTNKNRISCEVCQETFRSKVALISHRRRTHFPEEKLSCHLCPAKFVVKRTLQRHLDLKHFDKGLKCPHCDYSCTQRYVYESHLRKHTGEKPFMCDVCGKTFLQLTYLKNHRKYHEDKPYKCETCGHAFMHLRRYERHMRTHTNPQLHWKVRQKLAREAAKKVQTDSV